MVRLAFSILQALVTPLCPALALVYVTSHDRTGFDVVIVNVPLTLVCGDMPATAIPVGLAVIESNSRLTLPAPGSHVALL